jgi:hypothetical protein
LLSLAGHDRARVPGFSSLCQTKMPRRHRQRRSWGVCDTFERNTRCNSTGILLLLPTTLQIPGIVGPHIYALKATSQGLLEILPIIDLVSGQVIEPSFGRVSQVDGEELDDEEVIVCPTRPVHEAVVLQPDVEIGLAIILDNVVGHTEMPSEAHIAHIAPEHFRSWPLRAKAMPDVVPTVGCTIVVLCRLALEWPSLKKETSAHRWSELSACYSVAMPRMPIS